MSVSNKKCSDIIISGGGMVGMSLAVALAQEGLRVAVIEKTGFDAQHLPTFDGRVSAIAHGSRLMLEMLGVWQFIGTEAEPIWDIRVSDADSTAHLHYKHSEVGTDAFGHIVENRHVRMALFKRAASLQNLVLYAPDTVEAIHVSPGKTEICLASGGELTAPLLAGAEGRQSAVRLAAGITLVGGSYNQTAIVCTIAHSYPHRGLAQERFLPGGPFAVLPMTNNRSSLVWVETPEIAAHMLTLPEAELLKEIRARVGNYLGELSLAGERFTYPLGVQHAKDYVAERIALIGDAAHGIHPLAGQGLNLGLRDAAALAERVLDAARLGLDIGGGNVLAAYQQWRRFDNVAMTVATDGLNRLFTTDLLPVVLSRRLGMEIVGKLPALKRYFIKNAMGTVGDLPRLLQGKAA